MKSKIEPKKKGHKAYKELMTLGKDRLALIDAMLIKGDTPLQVVRMIQQEWGNLTSISEAALRQTLYRYKEDRLGQEIVMHEAAIDRMGKMAYLKDVRVKFQGIHDMVDLVMVQRARLNKMLIREEQMPVIMDQVSREVQSMASLMERTLRLQLDLGIIQPQNSGQAADDEELRLAYKQSVQLSAKLKDLTGRALSVIEGDFEVQHGGDNPEALYIDIAGAISSSGESQDNLQAGQGNSG